MLSEYIKEKRLESNLSQIEVANSVNVHLRVYQRWEAGEFIPSAKNLFDLIDILHLDQFKVRKLIQNKKE